VNTEDTLRNALLLDGTAMCIPVSAVQPTPSLVRSQSAVELAATFRHHQTQRSKLQVRSTANTAQRTKRPDMFVRLEKVNTF
jgi:hypothetical protein